jgi:hypothetical protein
MKPAILIIALCAASMPAISQNDAQTRPAFLPSVVGLHLGTRHDDSGKQQGQARTWVDASGTVFQTSAQGWNNNTPGIYALWPLHQPQIGPVRATGHLAIGHIARNSLFQPSTYAAYHLRSQPLATRLGAFSAGASAGVFFNGYDKSVQANFNPAAPVPAGHSVKVRCSQQLGCVPHLVKPTAAPLLSAGVFWQANATSPLTLGLQRLPESGTTGSAAWTFTADWRF